MPPKRSRAPIRGIDAQIAHGDTFHNDKHPDLKADYVLANPPFNDSDWRGDLLMLEKYEVCLGLFHGFDWSHWARGTAAQKLSVLPGAQEHILAQDDGKARLLKAVTELSKAFALAVPNAEAIRIRDDVGFFQAVRSVLAKAAPGVGKSDDDLDHAIRQIVSKAVVSDQVVDIFAAAGLKKPDIWRDLSLQSCGSIKDWCY